MHATRHFAPPAVDLGAQRNLAALIQQRRAQRTWNVLVTTAAFALAYAFANAPFALIVLTVASGVALGATVNAIRGFGERYRMIRNVAPVLAHNDAQALARVVHGASRGILRLLIVTGALLLTTLAWAVAGQSRWPIVLASLLALAYLRSSVKPSMGGTPRFGELAAAARASGCRITLFRSFDPSASRLTRNVLLPILAGYGDLHVVFDPTLGNVEAESFLGETTQELEQWATVHRFDHPEWRARVGELIARTDIAVIEATRLTPGVAWEFARCVKDLPPWRVYPIVDTDGLDGVSVGDHFKMFHATVGQEPDMPPDVRTRWFYLGEGASRQETVAEDVHQKMLTIIAIESGREDASAFGPGAAAWLPARAG
jgi:hypothetical protein